MRAAFLAALLVLAGCAAPQVQPIATIGYPLTGEIDDYKEQTIMACQVATFMAYDKLMVDHPDAVVTEADVKATLRKCIIDQGITI